MEFQLWQFDARLSGVLILISCTCVLVSCSGTWSPGTSRTNNQKLEGETFTDKNGWTWHKVETVDEYVTTTDEELPSQDEPDAKPTIGEMSVDSIAEKYRPLLHFDGNVYRLSEEATATLAEEMENQYEEGLPPIEPESTPFEPTSTKSSDLRSRRQNLTFGSDDRLKADADLWPERAIAGAQGDCTAFKSINHFTALTAAHCVYTAGEGWDTPEDWHFEAAGSSNTPALNRWCYSTIIPSGFTRNGHIRFDFAVLRFHGTGENCSLDRYNKGYLGATTIAEDADHEILGYPSDTSDWGGGELLLQDSGRAWLPNSYPNRAFNKIDASFGQSGAPVSRYFAGWEDYVSAASILRGSVYTPFSWKHEGRRFDGGLISWFKRMSGSW